MFDLVIMSLSIPPNKGFSAEKPGCNTTVHVELYTHIKIKFPFIWLNMLHDSDYRPPKVVLTFVP